MFFIIISLLLTLNVNAENLLCSIVVKDKSAKILSIVSLENSTDSSSFIIKNTKKDSAPDSINYSYKDGSIDATVGVPSIKKADIESFYKSTVAALKKEPTKFSINKNVFYIVELNNLDNKCIDSNIATMLFFIREWFYAE